MTCLLNDEIRAIKHTMAHLKKGMSLESDSGKKHQMKKDYEDLQKILEEKLEKCNDLSNPVLQGKWTRYIYIVHCIMIHMI